MAKKDKDGDFIDLREFRRGVQQLDLRKRIGFTNDQADLAFRLLDRGGAGSLNWREIIKSFRLAALAKKTEAAARNSPRPPSPRRELPALDPEDRARREASVMITLEMLRAHFGSLRQIFTAMDRNKDSFVTLDEFRSGVALSAVSLPAGAAEELFAYLERRQVEAALAAPAPGS